jgi:SAM-dependent methyltransferase
MEEEKRARRLLDRLSPSRWMRRDWDRRARENAQHFIACGHSETDAAFWESGKHELESLVLRDVILTSEARALEIGCGVGRLLRPLSERIARVYGVDISIEMVKRARCLLADRQNVEIFSTRGRLDRIPDAALDFLYSFIVFQHIPTKKAVERYIRESARVLSGGGVFRFQVDGRPREGRRADTWLGVWYQPAELTRELGRAGFETVSLWGEHTHYLWVTALRRSRRDRPDTAAARVRRRVWRRSALEAFLTRLGVDPEREVAAVSHGQRSLRQLAQRFLDAEGDSAPDEFVKRAYEVLLGRPADPSGLAFYSKEIANGIPSSNTIDCLISSAELEDQLRTDSPGPEA